MVRSIFFASASRFNVPPLRLLIGAAILACLFSNTASAQTFTSDQKFTIDLDKVSKIYDELDPRRTAKAVGDTLRVGDITTVPFGNQYFRVPNFLRFDFDVTQTIVEYGWVPDTRVTFTLPSVYRFDLYERPDSLFIVYDTRDLTIPGLKIEFRSIEQVAEDIRVESLNQVWKDTSRETILSQTRTTTRGGAGGITINIPVPMPRQLESIFGPSDKTHITINGREEITIAGETKRVSNFIGSEGRQSQSLFPSLDMEQNLDVSLKGTIGDKVHIQVEHSSQAISDDANRISVNYIGYEDDVIQQIDLGNTTLSLPGSNLVNFSSGQKGLFGIKVLAKLGATNITFIASKTQGESSSASFSPTGGQIGEIREVVIRDVDYIRDKYFYFDDPAMPLQLIDSNTLRVFRSIRPNEDPTLIREPGYALIETTTLGLDIAAVADDIRFNQTNPGSEVPLPLSALQSNFTELVQDIDFFFIVESQTNLPIGIELASPISENSGRSLCVTYAVFDGDEDPSNDIRVGGNYTSFNLAFAERDTLLLKMIKAEKPRPDGLWGFTWRYMIRNFYSLGLTNIDLNTLEIEIEDLLRPRPNPTIPDSTTVPYLKIFGLDQTDRTGLGPPDGLVDASTDLIDPQRGILRFPRLRAFAPDTASVRLWTAGEFSFADSMYQEQFANSERIYDEFIADIDIPDVYQYNIRVRAVSTSRSFSINAFDIVEGSERITMDGQPLVRGTDYVIDYQTGEVELRGNAIARMRPDSRINVDYEFKPFGGGGSSSLVGFNAISSAGKNARFGTTLLYESKNVAADKPRIGEEPTRTFVGGSHANIQLQPKFLTDLVNMLPLVDTDSPSSVTMSGEIAASFPNPNTKNEAYIDDFEGVDDSDRISMVRRNWWWTSTPIDTALVPRDDLKRLPFLWYNIEGDLVTKRRDLNPNLDERENTVVTTLDIELDADPDTTSSEFYVGVMSGFAGGLDLSQGQFVEIWVNDFKPDSLDRGGLLHIDLGYIDEDFFEPAKGEDNQEDSNQDGFIAATEDTGLDGIFDEDEGTGEDPAGDNIDVSRINGRFTKINGTEANNIEDTEDLNRNTRVDRVNGFFSWVIDLANTVPEEDIRESFPGYDGFDRVGHGRDSWRLYRLRITDGVVVAPSGLQPDLQDINHARIWFDDVSAVFNNNANEAGYRRFQIAGLTVKGNRWTPDGVRENSTDAVLDSTNTEFEVRAISTKSDPSVYRPPIRPNETDGVLENESSLAMSFTDLADSTNIRVRRQFLGQGLDMVQYRDLNMWVYADRNTRHEDLEYFIRFATSRDNYYEFTIPMKDEFFGANNWSRVLTKMSDLTNLKLAPVDSLGEVRGFASDEVEPSRQYPTRMVGNPSIFNIRFIYAGVRNIGPEGALHSGEIWINDIYGGDVRRDADLAAQASLAVNMGGVLSFGVNWGRRGPDFRGLRQSRGSGSLEESIAVNGKTALQHFIPMGGFLIPVNAAWARRVSKPKFTPTGDTEIIEESHRDSLRTETVNRTFTTQLQKRGSKNPILKYTFDKLTSSFSYSDVKRRTSTVRDTTNNIAASLGYNIVWSTPREINLLNRIKFRYWINSFEFRTAANRGTTRSWRNIGGEFVEQPFRFRASLNNSGTINYKPFKTMSGTFTAAIARDPALPHDWYGVNVGRETSRNHSSRIGWEPNFWVVRPFKPTLDLRSSYSEDSSPNVRRPGDPTGTRNVGVGRQTSLKVFLEVGKYFQKMFDAMGFDPYKDDVPNQPTTPARPLPSSGGGSVLSQPRPQPVPPPSTATGDSTTAETDTTETRRGDPMIAVRQLGKILAGFRRINGNVSHRLTNNYERIGSRPSWPYQLGLTTDTGLGEGDEAVDTPNRLTESWNMNFTSGVEISRYIDLKGNYTRSIGDSDFQSSKTRSTTTTWPDVQVNWSGLERLGLLRPFFTQVQLTFSFQDTKTTSGRKNQDPNNTRTQRQISPAFQFTWKNEISSNLAISYNKSTTTVRGSGSETTNLSVSLDFRKQFRGGAGFKLPIPFFSKEVNWASTLDSNLRIAFNRSGGKRTTEGINFSEPIPSNSTLIVSPNVSYQFSNALNGRAFVVFTRAYSESTDQTTTSFRLGVSVILTF